MKRVWIATSQDEFDRCKRDGLNVVLLDFSKPLEADEFVFVGPGCRQAMEEFRARGISETELSFFEDGQIKDWNWDFHRSIDRLDEAKPSKYLPCGISGLGNVMQWRLPELGIVAGPFGAGKSLFVQILAQDFVFQNKMPASLTCWEDQAHEIREALGRFSRTAQFEGQEEFRERFLSMFSTTVVKYDTDRRMSVHFDRIRYENKRYGTKFFVLDPWNEFDHEKSYKQTEGEYVISVLNVANRLAHELNIIIILTTHVSGEHVSTDGKIKGFRISHAFGSSQYGNKVHRGFCIVRSRNHGDQTHTIVRHDKAKEEDRFKRKGSGDYDSEPFVRRMGRVETLAFEYCSNTNSLYYDAKVSTSEEIVKIWGS